MGKYGIVVNDQAREKKACPAGSCGCKSQLEHLKKEGNLYFKLATKRNGKIQIAK